MLLALVFLCAGAAGNGTALAQVQVSNPMIAPPGACPDQGSVDAPAVEQRRALLCMTDFARRRAGLVPLADARNLDWSARAKSGDILRCGSFSHFACGRGFTYWMRESGYLSARCWRAGENLAWGLGKEGTARSIFVSLWRSPHHRHNILGPFDRMGIGLRVGYFRGRTGVRVWTQHFGSRCASRLPPKRGGKI